MSEQARAALAALPRTPLAHLPTPVEPLPRFSAALGGPEIWVKRDDATGLATGGNKTRKLEYLMADALAQGADCAITAGSTQSNHARQTAAAARKLGLEPHLVLYAPGGEAPPAGTPGNVLIDRLLGAQIHWTEERAPYTQTIEQVRAALAAAGRRPAVIPYGGSNAVGLMGYAAALIEFDGQAADLPRFDAHVFATSSGGTQAGMVLGAHLLGWPVGEPRLVGISVDEDAADLRERVARLAAEGAALLGTDAPDPARIEVDDGYLGGGYAVVGPPEREAIRLLAKTEGLLVDPVYTGRALAGLIDRVRGGVRGGMRGGAFGAAERVLFWHTGGAAALGAFAGVLVDG